MAGPFSSRTAEPTPSHTSFSSGPYIQTHSLCSPPAHDSFEERSEEYGHSLRFSRRP